MSGNTRLLCALPQQKVQNCAGDAQTRRLNGSFCRATGCEDARSRNQRSALQNFTGPRMSAQ
jgi:hypothetical protein